LTITNEHALSYDSRPRQALKNGSEAIRHIHNDSSKVNLVCDVPITSNPVTKPVDVQNSRKIKGENALCLSGGMEFVRACFKFFSDTLEYKDRIINELDNNARTKILSGASGNNDNSNNIILEKDASKSTKFVQSQNSLIPLIPLISSSKNKRKWTDIVTDINKNKNHDFGNSKQDDINMLITID
jgi:hypothetical protein